MKKYARNQPLLLSIFILLVVCLATVVLLSNLKENQTTASHAASNLPNGPCQFQMADQPVNVAFCDTYDAPAGIGNRSGGLDGKVWGVSHHGDNGGELDGWNPSDQEQCGKTVSVQPESDWNICNGMLVESINDGGSGPMGMGAYVKQPFDFAGRTGTITFDVSDDTGGTHAAWPEFWITDKPVPMVLTNGSGTGAGLRAVPQNGFGFRLSRIPGHCLGVDSFGVISNYQDTDIFPPTTNFPSGNIECVKQSTGPGDMNHLELRISQNQVDLYGADAGTTSPMKHIASLSNAGLTFTRGLIWLEDVHYNACKYPDTQCVHTFVWDNVGFDGPLLPRDLAFDVNDHLTPGNNGHLQLGWTVSSSTIPTLQTQPVSGIAQASSGLLTYSLTYGTQSTLSYNLNNHGWHDIPYPYPDFSWASFRTFAQPINLAEVIPGVNTIQVKTNNPNGDIIANVDLIMVGAGGLVPPCLTCPTATPIPTPTATPIPPAGSAIAIDAGLIDTFGGIPAPYVYDTDYVGGGIRSLDSHVVDTNGVANAAPPAVYQSTRQGSTFSYVITNELPNQPYKVRLHFNETVFGIQEPGGVGSRVFNVTINGNPVLTNFDVFATAGGAWKAVVKEFTVPADSTGKITIQFTSVVDIAMVSGIEVIPAGPTPTTCPACPTATPIPTQTPTPTSTPTPTPQPISNGISIDSGGTGSGSYVTDNFFTGGAVSSTVTDTIDTTGVTNPAPQAVYQNVRYNNFSYTISGLTANTNYQVRLHFAETWWGIVGRGGRAGVGSRKFNVSINGNQVLTNFDIFASAGAADKAVVQTFTTPSDSTGKITIQFTNVVDNAQINGIEVLLLGSIPTNTPTATPTTVPTQIPSPTVTPASTSLSLIVKLHGLGNGGDNANATGGNIAPVHTNRSISVSLFNASNQEISGSPFLGSLTYDYNPVTQVGSKFFLGTINLPPSVPNGFYTVRVLSPGFLSITLPSVISVTQGSVTIVPTLSLITADVNGDNTLDLRDYNMILNTLGTSVPVSATLPTADITDDGVVDIRDLNQIVREFSLQRGN